MPNQSVARQVMRFLQEDAAGPRMEMALLLAIAAGLAGLAILALYKMDPTKP